MQIDESNILIFQCPHCELFTSVEKKDLNCKIFRHGNYKTNNQSINPHASKIECDELVLNDKIYGCGKPFKIIINNNEFNVEICDYI